MAYDEGLAETLRGDLEGRDVREQKMFGGLCFMLEGHMLCGAMSGHAMFRVGAANMPAATALDGVDQVEMGGRRMTGFVWAAEDAAADDDTRAALLKMATGFVATLPPK
ncbi:TfoX/Sxy family protein [Anianabacter salinae]|uniref:TfoX/Sxy family protein n=1 Tax=Anianabacter salinae TaxID=2851023 RepID=UPI00225E6AFB|nr:TfoX/Sxy family protein [Anianabacter salinae]MBV0911960.1 TfoX/Sxy family protein [Anianabacter salinae]